jgi:hypothetical protein
MNDLLCIGLLDLVAIFYLRITSGFRERAVIRNKQAMCANCSSRLLSGDQIYVRVFERLKSPYIYFDGMSFVDPSTGP